MIAPQTSAEARYVHNLAALYVRAHEQLAAGDQAGSNTLMATWRSLQEMGTAFDTPEEPRSAGLIEYAHLLAHETPRSDRLTAFMAKQDAALATPEPEPEPESDLRPESPRSDLEPEPEPEPDPEPAPAPATRPRRSRKKGT